MSIEVKLNNHPYINDKTAREARKLWEKNKNASQIECALMIATRHVEPLMRRVQQLEQRLAELEGRVRQDELEN